MASWSRLNRLSSMPSDELGGLVARAIQTPGRQRDALTAGIYLPSDPEEPLSRLERALSLTHHSAAIDAKIRSAIRASTLPRDRPARLVQQAIAVDSFGPEEYPGRSQH